MDPDQLIIRAKSVGLDGVCLTDHDHTWGEDFIARLRDKHDFLVIGGAEISTDEGDILVFGFHESVRDIYDSYELREKLDDCGGVMILAHPFRFDPGLVGRYFASKEKNNHSSQDILEKVGRRDVFSIVDALEVCNGQSGRQEKVFTKLVADQVSLRGTGGSDAHATLGVGNCYTVFEEPVTNERDLIDQIKSGSFYGFDDRWKD